MEHAAPARPCLRGPSSLSPADMALRPILLAAALLCAAVVAARGEVIKATATNCSDFAAAFGQLNDAYSAARTSAPITLQLTLDCAGACVARAPGVRRRHSARLAGSDKLRSTGRSSPPSSPASPGSPSTPTLPAPRWATAKAALVTRIAPPTAPPLRKPPRRPPW